MGATHRPYSDEFKAEAVKFVLDGGRSLAEVARNIGCHELTLGKWVRKARQEREAAGPPEQDDPATGQPLSDAERVELIRLRAELKEANASLKELRMQVDFAKKVATWFAKDRE